MAKTGRALRAGRPSSAFQRRRDRGPTKEPLPKTADRIVRELERLIGSPLKLDPRRTRQMLLSLAREASFTPKERAVFMGRLNGKSREELAKTLGVTTQRISGLEIQAVYKMWMAREPKIVGGMLE